ncbi:hypothetical protein ACHAP6_004313 [Verticillium nonalfalfae]
MPKQTARVRNNKDGILQPPRFMLSTTGTPDDDLLALEMDKARRPSAEPGQSRVVGHAPGAEASVACRHWRATQAVGCTAERGPNKVDDPVEGRSALLHPSLLVSSPPGTSQQQQQQQQQQRLKRQIGAVVQN